MKAFAFGIALAGLALVARSAAADPSLDRVRACMPQQNDAARLACYDKELGRAATAPAASTAPAIPATAPASPARSVSAAPVTSAPAGARATTVAPATATARATTVAPPTAAPPVAAATPAKASDFGMTPELRHKQQVQEGIHPPAPPPQSLSAKVAKVGTHGNGLLVVTLDNGQVWEQQESGDVLLAVGDVVKISRGVFGALWMDDASHRRTRVKRIQ